jgi:hypothetical protein
MGGKCRYSALFDEKTEGSQSVATGRPPLFADPTLINCGIPLDETTEYDVDGPKPALEFNGLPLARHIVSHVVMLTSIIELPQYQEILALDSVIRAKWGSNNNVTGPLSDQLGALKRAIITGPYRALSSCLGSSCCA